MKVGLAIFFFILACIFAVKAAVLYWIALHKIFGLIGMSQDDASMFFWCSLCYVIFIKVASNLVKSDN